MRDVEYSKADTPHLRLTVSILMLSLLLGGTTPPRARSQENSSAAANSRANADKSPLFETKVDTFGWDEFIGTNRLPRFKDPNTVPNLHLEGNWILKEYEDGRLIGVTYISLHKGRELVLSLLYTPSRSGVLSGPWRFIYGQGWRIDKNGNKHEVYSSGYHWGSIGPDGTVSLAYGDKVSVTLRPHGSGGMSGDWKEDNNWTNTHRKGTATFKKITPSIDSIKFIGDKTDVVEYGERAGRLEFEYQGPTYGRMRGNRRRVNIQILGENLWGCHRLWIDPVHHLEIGGAAINGEAFFPNGVRDSVKGVSVGVVTWPEMFPGRKVLWIDDIPIPFDLVLNNYPEERLAQAERINAELEEGEEQKNVELRYVRRTEGGYETLQILPFYQPIYVELEFEEEPEQSKREVVVEVEGTSLTLATRKISATLFRSNLPFWLEPEQEEVLVQP